MRKGLLLSVFVVILSGCGFHLRGLDTAREIPAWLNHVAIILESASRELEPPITNQLEAYHIAVAPSRAKAQY